MVFFAIVSLNQAIAQNNLTLSILCDQYKSEISWELLNADDEIIVDSLNYGVDYDTIGIFPLPDLDILNLPDGDYTFKWFDSAEDGICCAYGNGYYSLSADENNVTVAYGTQEAVYNFTLPAVAPPLTLTPLSIELAPFADGFINPVDIKCAGDSRLFIVEQLGKIKIVNPDGSVNPTSFLDITNRVSDDGGERGLLGLAFHPSYATNGYFYVNYIKTNGDTRISRFKVSEGYANIADPDSELVIYEADQPYSNHNGGEVQFGQDGYLYIGMGDGGSADDPEERAQNLNSPMGKMLRLNIDGVEPYEIPVDNPFIDQANVLPEIWAYGLRNPWRFSFDSENGDLWIGDVGQNLWEEVDYFKNGSANGVNYGWDCYEGFEDFEPANCDGGTEVQYPIHVYEHPVDGFSITGGIVYRGTEFPNLFGKYVYGDYLSGNIWGITKENDTTFTNQTLKSSSGILASVFGEDINKNLYVADYGSGEIYKIEDTCPLPNPTIEVSNGILSSTAGVNYYWFLNGSQLDSTTNTQTLSPEVDGTYYVVVEYDGGCVQQSNPIEATAVGLSGNFSNAGIEIYPNPAKNYIVLKSKSKIEQPLKIELIDALGRNLKTWNLSNLQEMKQLDISNIATGMYNLNVYIGSKKSTFNKKLVVNHE